MAVQPQTPFKEYIANGVTTVFPLDFDCKDKDHLIVMIDDAEADNSTWSLTNDQVAFNVAPAADKKITLQRNTPYRRDRNYQAYDNSFRPGPVNDDFDWIWWKLQELGVADWILGARIDALKNYVDRKDDELKAYLMEEIRKQGVALDQLDDYYNYLMQRLAQIAVDKGWDASFVVDGDKTQHQINEEQKNINNKKTNFLSSIQKLIEYQSPKDGEVFTIESYFDGWALEIGYEIPSGGGDFVYRRDSVMNEDGGCVISPSSKIGRYHRLKTGELSFEDFGADRTGLTVSTQQIKECLKFAISHKSTVIAENSYLITSIDLSEVSGNLELNLKGIIKRQNSVLAGDLLTLGNKDVVSIYGGGTIDFNYQNQMLWLDGITIDSAKVFSVNNMTLLNPKKSAIYTRSRNFDSILIKSNIFKEGALHSGVASEFCTMLLNRGGKNIEVKQNKFIQTTSSPLNQNRTPCGYLNIDTAALTPGHSASIKYNYFENLGMYCAGNILSPLDFYSFCEIIEIKHNKFRLCNFTPIRTSSGKNIVISNNDVIQTKQIILDGGQVYADASMIAAGLVDRGYNTDKNDVENALISNNTLNCQNISVRGISCSSNSTTNIFRTLTIKENNMRSSGTNSEAGVFTNAIQCVEVSGGQIEGFGTGVRFQGTSNNTAIVTDGNASLNIKKLKVKNCLTGIFARDSVTNADIYIENSQLIGSTNLSFTVRNAASLSVKGTRLGGQRGDVSALSVFIFKDNIPGTASLPVGHDTCTYFRLRDNIGQVDAVSV